MFHLLWMDVSKISVYFLLFLVCVCEEGVIFFIMREFEDVLKRSSDLLSCCDLCRTELYKMDWILLRSV